ncbi:phosphotransferase [Segatella bryantii]|uniref:Phosphotransferase n=1 Tax=Segatella bryantii TaxID=77095 RepID=A0ABX4EHH0_SEGBR|nr:phosphotransferase [Segatella bryantii]OYP53636.1 phosphotransferase [Segatella bryantii]UKK81865.1 hypothetical protein L6474_12110 [Segatella bryantii]
MINRQDYKRKLKYQKSLLWIREQSMDANCIESVATHDTDVKPHVIDFK